MLCEILIESALCKAHIVKCMQTDISIHFMNVTRHIMKSNHIINTTRP